MANPKVEVVVSGIGGWFPECNNLDELKTLLFEKTNGVTEDNRRWIAGALGTPHATGKIKSPDKFDNVFFGIHRKMTESLDALTKISLERSVEAIVDAGLSPVDLSGTNTAVFMSSCVSESEFFEVFNTKKRGFGILGHNRAMQANRLSYTLNLNGPSYTTDSTWIGGAQGLMRAKRMIEDGLTNAAIVGTCSLCLNPNMSLQLEGLGRLSQELGTKCFSADANGTNRAESCVAIFLQKSTEAKRSYGTLLNATAICGDTGNVFTHYSAGLYEQTLLDAYKAAGVDPATVNYVEAEGLGVKKVDAMELNVLEKVFCSSRRKEPLKIGSVKSNVGHCEASSSLVSLAKALIVLDTGYIPPNLNYTEPDPGYTAITSGKIEVVTEKTPLTGDTIGVSTFGLCNSFSHLIIKQNKKIKTRKYIKGQQPFNDSFPRLVPLSARNEEGLSELIEKAKNSEVDEEYAALLQSVFYNTIYAHHYRSYTIFPSVDDKTQEETTYIPALTKRPIWFIFSGMGSQWNGMGKQLLDVPIFADSIRKSEAVLKPRGVDLMDILTSDDPKLFDNILNAFVGIAAIQIGLVDVLKALGIEPNGIVGHSVGELGCAYADGCFTAEQMILAAHARGRASIETELIPGMMAAIGMGYNQIKDRLPQDIEVACHNASDSSTLSGPTESVNKFVDQLKSEGVFAKVVNVSNIAYHSRYIKPAAPTLLKYLKEVIPESKPRSSKWISSSIPESEWGNKLSLTSSPEYHTNNLLGQVLFEEASKHIPENAIAIEIAPHGLLQAILKRSLNENVTNIPLTHRSTKDSVRFLLNAIGKMYVNGMTPNIEALYPPISFPVSRGTPYLHSIFPWDHTEKWTLSSMVQTGIRLPSERIFNVTLNNDPILLEHTINGRHIIPSSSLLCYVWKSFLITNNQYSIYDPIVFQEVRFLKSVEITEVDKLEFYSLIHRGTGHFEICLQSDIIVSGRIFHPDAMEKSEMDRKMQNVKVVSGKPSSSIAHHDVYSSLEDIGYNLGVNFKNITNIDLFNRGCRANIKWTNEWVCFLNAVISLQIYQDIDNCSRPLEWLTIRELYINPEPLKNMCDKDISVHYCLNTNEFTSDGIYISHATVKPLSLNVFEPVELRLEEEEFMKLNNQNIKSGDQFISNCMQIILEKKNYQVGFSLSNLDVYYGNTNNDNILASYLKSIKSILDTHLSIRTVITNMDNANVNIICQKITKGYNVALVSKNRIQDATLWLSNKKNAFIIVLSDEPLQNHKDWSVITQQKLNNKYSVLLKKTKVKTYHSLEIKNISDIKNIQNELSVVLDKNHSSKRLLYIVTKIIPFENISNFINDVVQGNHSKKLRFVFLLDESAPTFDVNSPFYKEQLQKNIVVNIYKNKEWGTLTKHLIADSVNDAIPEKNPPSQIDALSLEGLSVKCLGINFKDITVNNNAANELGYLEYSGLTSEGKRVMGIAPFETTSKHILPIPGLVWEIPSDWSLEDAATVPIPYTLAYYMLTCLNVRYLPVYTVLVHAGFHPVGQAAIAISLSFGFDVFTTVANEEQASLLKKKFPQLPESRIFSYEDSRFEVDIRIATKGLGVSIVINCLNGNEFHASVDLIAKQGKFFQLTKTDMKNYEKMGLKVFLKVIAFYAISPGSLRDESDKVKFELQNEMKKGIELGVVKPFDRCVLTGPCTGKEAIKALKSTSQGLESKRVVLSLEGEKLLSKSISEVSQLRYQCFPNKIYLIIGSKYSAWIDLAEWLALRGARKIIVAIKKHAMSTTVSRRFNFILSRYDNIIFQVVSESNFNSKKDVVSLLKDATATNPLAGVFFATMMDGDEKLRNIQYAFEHFPSKPDNKPFLVCILSGGVNICSELRESGACANAVSIAWDSTSDFEPKLPDLLSSLDKVLLNLDTVATSTIICSENDKKDVLIYRDVYANMTSHFPNSVEELDGFGDYITDEPVFVEVPTNSQRSADSHCNMPIFVVTGFRPAVMHNLYKNIKNPTFEARLPEQIESIEKVASDLLKKLKEISSYGSVSLVGISWGGPVCIWMAQMLEAENISVSLTLLEGTPNLIVEWSKSLLQDGSINTKLVTKYFPLNNTKGKQINTDKGWNTELPNVLKSIGPSSVTANTLKALNAIRSRLNAIFNMQRIPNKLYANIQVFKICDESKKINIYNLHDYCKHIPTSYVSDQTDYIQILSDKKFANVINSNILHYHPDSIDVLISETYSRAEYSFDGYIVA